MLNELLRSECNISNYLKVHRYHCPSANKEQHIEEC